MRLTPRETDKLMLHYAGTVAASRLEKGLKLNYPEAIAYISRELLELAREGKTVPYNDLGVMMLAYDWGDNSQQIAALDAYARAIKAPKEVRVGSMKLCKRFMKIWKNLKEFPLVSAYQKQIAEGLSVGNHSIAVGLYARDCGLECEVAASIYTYNQICGMVTNGVKSVPLSQRSGQEILQEAIREIPDVVARAKKMKLDDLGVGGTEFDIYAMNHEYMYSRLYMS